MEIDIPKRKHSKVHNYNKEDLHIAKNFAHELHKEMGKLLKAVVLFGSAARNTTTKRSDIDVMVIVDDTDVVISKDVADAYRIVIERIISKVSRRLHVVTLRLTLFWDYMRKGDPIGINILRDGISLYDSGFFDPLQLLLTKGKIRPSDESIWTYYNRAPTTLNNSKWHLSQAVIDLYWAVIDSAHAALMSQDTIPPTPEHVADLLDNILVKKGKLEKKYSKIMRSFYKRAKAIMHKEVDEVKGEEFDKYYKEASDFVDRMRKFISVK
jgi:uncharacterized protein (UPF0332 family)/predicted nucleotidyltransferase